MTSLAAAPARAICTPPAANFITAVCSGVTINQNNPFGYGTFLDIGVNLTVLPGASVIGTDTGVSHGVIFRLTNHGTITGGSFGVRANIGAVLLINNGTISTTNPNGDGLAASSIQILINNGSISGGRFGVAGGAVILSLANRGTISGRVTGVEAAGINHLTNSGTISGSDHAIRETGADHTTLTLLPGSILIGRIDLGGGINILNVGRGLSIANTFVGGAPLIGDTGGQPFAVSGNQVAVVDPTTLAAQDDLVSTLTGLISTNIFTRLNGVRLGGPTAQNSGQRLAFLPRSGVDPKWQWTAWFQGFGAWRDMDADGAAGDSDLSLGGVVAGADRAFGSIRAGLFVGGMTGSVEASLGTQDTDITGIFFGIYAQASWGAYVISGALTGGILDYDRTRIVANNLAPGGLQTATAGYQGYFISPEITVVRPVTVFGLSVEPGVTLRYAALGVDGFRETGAADNFAVNSRTIHVFQGRLHLSLPIRFETLGGQLRVTPKIAVEGRSQVGGRTVSGTLLGQGISFDPGGARSVAAGVAALSLSYTRGRVTLFTAAEGKYETDGSHQASVRGGIRIRF